MSKEQVSNIAKKIKASLT
ncbi:unnamed protein product, partial [Rotaria sp. Silwood2]